MLRRPPSSPAIANGSRRLLGADAVFDRHLHIVEDHLCSRRGVPAELAFLRAEADLGHVLFDDEAASMPFVLLAGCAPSSHKGR